jgi:hypothetical protein
MKEKYCLFCEHFIFDFGTEDYSEYIDGEDVEVFCAKGKWGINVGRMSDCKPFIKTKDYFMVTNINELRNALKIAKNCTMYEELIEEQCEIK